MASSKPITELDFATIKEALKTFLQSQNQFSDYDFDSSTMSVILDVLAYNTFINNFYTSMAISEMFLDTSQLRSSIMSHAKELNYLPRSYRSAIGKINLTFSPEDEPVSISIPKYTKFTSSIDGSSYTFSTNEAYTVHANSGVYSITGVSLYEGIIEKEYYQAGADTQYIISNKQVDTTSIAVRIYASSDVSATYEEYVYKQNLFNVSATDKVFYLNPTNKDKYEVHFGNDVFGREPVSGEIVEITYLISSGESPNGASSFAAASTISGYTPIITTSSVASGGSEYEDIESIRFNAPKSIQIQDRVVTESDYVNLLKSQFSEIVAVSAIGGERFNPPKYGKVVVLVDTTDGDGVSDNNKQKYYNFLKDRTPLSIDPMIMSAGFFYVDIDCKVYYRNGLTDKSSSAIETLVRSALSSYSTSYLNDFGKILKYSKLVTAIDNADTSISSNDTDVRIVYDFIPTLNTNSSVTIDFGNPIGGDSHALVVGEDITKHNPGIKSSSFTYNGDTCYLQDNGTGTLNILTNTVDGFRIASYDVGSVEYDTGKVTIQNLNVSAYIGTAIKIYAHPDNLLFITPKDKIIAIRDADVKITVDTSTE